MGQQLKALAMTGTWWDYGKTWESQGWRLGRLLYCVGV